MMDTNTKENLRILLISNAVLALPLGIFVYFLFDRLILVSLFFIIVCNLGFGLAFLIMGKD